MQYPSVRLAVLLSTAVLAPATRHVEQQCAPIPPVEPAEAFDCTAAQRAMSKAATPPSCMCRMGKAGDKRCVARGDPSDPESTKWAGDGLMRSQGQEDKYVFRTFFSDARFRNGHDEHTFVELGAYTGMALSNSYFFEKVLGWRGVLIEANDANFKKLRDESKRARASKIRAAVCQNTTLLSMSGGGGNAALNYSAAGTSLVDTLDLSAIPPGLVLCLPMAQVLTLAGLSTDPTVRGVDFFSLDVRRSAATRSADRSGSSLPSRLACLSRASLL